MGSDGNPFRKERDSKQRRSGTTHEAPYEGGAYHQLGGPPWGGPGPPRGPIPPQGHDGGPPRTLGTTPTGPTVRKTYGDPTPVRVSDSVRRPEVFSTHRRRVGVRRTLRPDRNGPGRSLTGYEGGPQGRGSRGVGDSISHVAGSPGPRPRGWWESDRPGDPGRRPRTTSTDPRSTQVEVVRDDNPECPRLVGPGTFPEDADGS